MRDGVPWVIPPDWVDRERRPLRNTYRDDAATMHRLGTRLRLDLDPQSGPAASGPGRTLADQQQPEDGPDPPAAGAA